MGNWNSRSLTGVRTIPTANALTSPVPRSLGAVHLKVPKGGRFREEGVHHQSSTYGFTDFEAREVVANLDAFHSGWSWSEGQRLRGGLSLLWDVFTDETPASSDMNVWVPAAFAEMTGSRGTLSWIHGLRVELPSNHGVVLAPRMNVKWSPTTLLDARINAGRGYRRVHLFTEEHAALDGSRQVLIDEGGLNLSRAGMPMSA